MSNHVGNHFTERIRRMLATGAIQHPLSACGELFVAVDWSGQSRGLAHELMSVLVVARESLQEWEPHLVAMRSHMPQWREMAFKRLGDGYVSDLLIPFLESTLQFKGYLLSLGVAKGLELTAPPPDAAKLANYLRDSAKFKQGTFERAMLTIVIVSSLIAELGSPSDEVTVIFDNDSLFDTSERRDVISAAFRSFMQSEAMPAFAKLHVHRCSDLAGTHERLVKDLLAVPDLACGGFGEILASIFRSHRPSNSVLQQVPRTLSGKVNYISRWFRATSPSFCRDLVVVGKDARDDIVVSSLVLHSDTKPSLVLPLKTHMQLARRRAKG